MPHEREINNQLSMIGIHNFVVAQAIEAEQIAVRRALANDITRVMYVNGKRIHAKLTDAQLSSMSDHPEKIRQFLLDLLTPHFGERASQLCNFNYQMLSGPLLFILQYPSMLRGSNYKIVDSSAYPVRQHIYKKNNRIFLSITHEDFQITSEKPSMVIGKLMGKTKVFYELKEGKFELIKITTDNAIIHDVILGEKPDSLEFFTQEKYHDDFLPYGSPPSYLQELDNIIRDTHRVISKNDTLIECHIDLPQIKASLFTIKKLIRVSENKKNELMQNASLSTQLKNIFMRELGDHLISLKKQKNQFLKLQSYAMAVTAFEEVLERSHKIKSRYNELDILSDVEIAQLKQDYQSRILHIQYRLEDLDDVLNNISKDEHLKHFSETVTQHYLGILHSLKDKLLATKDNLITKLIEIKVKAQDDETVRLIASNREFIYEITRKEKIDLTFAMQTLLSIGQRLHQLKHYSVVFAENDPTYKPIYQNEIRKLTDSLTFLKDDIIEKMPKYNFDMKANSLAEYQKAQQANFDLLAEVDAYLKWNQTEKALQCFYQILSPVGSSLPETITHHSLQQLIKKRREEMRSDYISTFELATKKYCDEHTEKLTSYLKSRNAKYFLQDKISSWSYGCFFKTDKECREEYIERLNALLEQLKNTPFPQIMTVCKTLNETIEEGLKKYAPRLDGYQNSLRYCLLNLKHDIKDLQSQLPILMQHIEGDEPAINNSPRHN